MTGFTVRDATRRLRSVLALAALLPLGAAVGQGQQAGSAAQPPPTAGQQTPDPGPGRPAAGATPLAVPAASGASEAANSERRRQIAEDASRLLALANDLKAEVGKTNKDMLSLPVIRKADEIEKLARQVKEMMRLNLAAN